MRQRSARGMTLIELVIAMAIVVMLFASVVYGVGALTGAHAKESSTQLVGVIRNLYDTASLSGKTCRLVFEMPNEREDDKAVTYRAECAKGAITASAKRDDELKEQRNKKKDKLDDDDRRFKFLGSSENGPSLQELQEREKKRVDDAATFSGFTNEDVQDHTLPSNVRLEVWTAKQRDKAKSGPAYLYFFPSGFTERAQIWLRQGTNVWTITVSPLTGKTMIYGEDLQVPHS